MSNKSIINDRYIKNKIKIEPKICSSSSSGSEAQSIANIDEEEHEYGNEIDFENQSAILKHKRFNSLDIDNAELVRSGEETYSKT